MNELRIDIDAQRQAFKPGEEVAGTASWKLEKAPKAVELRLFWFTRGKGTQDASVVERLRFDTTSLDGNHSFRFRLPETPYSFSGKLISLVWALELIAEPHKEVTRVEIIVGPDAQEVTLGSAVQQSPNRFSLSK